MEHHSTMKRLSVVLAVLFGLLIGFRAFPDSNSGSSIGIQNGGSSIGAAAVLNCSTNMTCAVSGGIVSISASSSAGIAFSVITGGINSAAPMVVNTGASISATGTGTILGCTQDVSNNLTCGGSLAAGTGSTSGKLNLPGKTSHAVSAITVDDSNTATTVKLPNDVTAGLYLPTTTGATPAAGCAQFNGTSTQITSTGTSCGGGAGGATATGVYVSYMSMLWGPIYPATVPPAAASWSAGGATSTLADISGGGEAFTSPIPQTPGGWWEAAAGSTFTLTMNLYAVYAGSGVVGMFCSDSSGNAALFHVSQGSALSVSHWTGMQTGGTPAFVSSLASVTMVNVHFLRMVVTSTNRTYYYGDEAGTHFVQLTQEGNTAFVTCTRVGFHGYGDATRPSLGTVVSLTNTTP